MTREVRLEVHRTLGSVAFVFLAALAVRLVNLDRPPFWDELYHLLSARSLLENGTLEIVDGGAPYTRARMYTRAVAWSFRLFGESLVAARLPAILPGAALVAGLFAWFRRVADPRSAWILAFFLCLDPLGITSSQIYRFYALHALLFWIGAVAAFHLATGVGKPSSRAAGALLAVGALAAAHRLQAGLTLIGALALLISLGVVLGVRRVREPAAPRDRRWPNALILLGMAAAVVAVAAGHDFLLEAWARYRDTAVWSIERADRPTYYHGALLTLYPTLWTLLPLLALFAIAVYPALSLFAVSTFGGTFLLLSFAAQKSERYLFFVLPGFFIAASIALAHTIPSLRRSLETVLDRLPGSPSPRTRSVLGWASIAGVIVFAIGSNRAFAHSARLVLAPASLTYHAQPDWSGVAEWFRSSADSSAVVLSSAPTKAVYFLGRVDVSLDSRQLEGRPEFSLDHWVKAPIVSEPESLKRIVSCTPSGLAFIEDWHWKRQWYVPTPVAERLEREATRVPEASEGRVLVFRWDHEVDAAAGDCATLERSRALRSLDREPLVRRAGGR